MSKRDSFYNDITYCRYIPGRKKIEKTIRFVYIWKGLKADVKRFVNTVMYAKLIRILVERDLH